MSHTAIIQGITWSCQAQPGLSSCYGLMAMTDLRLLMQTMPYRGLPRLSVPLHWLDPADGHGILYACLFRERHEGQLLIGEFDYMKQAGQALIDSHDPVIWMPRNWSQNSD